MINIQVTGLESVRKLLGNAKAINTMAAKALNDTAREIQRQMPGYLKSNLDRPTPFTTGEKSMFVKFANADTLTATVAFKERQAAYLKYQFEGGARSGGARGIKLPGNIQLNAFGNIPKGTIDKLKAASRGGKLSKTIRKRIGGGTGQVTLFLGKPKGARWNGAPMGIYQRIPGKNGTGQLIPIVVFEDTQAQYKKRLDTLGFAAPIVDKTFNASFNARMKEVFD